MNAATGTAGTIGPVGATGCVGPRGLTGATGGMGPRGFTGATGATGIFDPNQVLFYVDSIPDVSPVTMGQHLCIESEPGINTHITNDPLTLHIDLDQNNAYGGLYLDCDTALHFDCPNKKVEIPLKSAMPFSNVLYDCNEIKIYKSGNYEINFMIRIQCPGHNLLGGPTRNGHFINSGYEHTQANNDFVFIQGSIIEELNCGDVITLALVSTAHGTAHLAGGVNASVTVKKLSEY